MSVVHFRLYCKAIIIIIIIIIIMNTEPGHPRYGVCVAPKLGIGIGTTSVPRYAHAENTQREIYKSERRFINGKGDL